MSGHEDRSRLGEREPGWPVRSARKEEDIRRWGCVEALAPGGVGKFREWSWKYGRRASDHHAVALLGRFSISIKRYLRRTHRVGISPGQKLVTTAACGSHGPRRLCTHGNHQKNRNEIAQPMDHLS